MTSSTGSAQVTDPLGSLLTMSFTSTPTGQRLTYLSQPGGAGCGPASSSIAYDANANVSSRINFNGQKTCYDYDLSRNLETKRVEGVAGSGYCASALTSPPAGSRLISTQWHPDWRLETKIAEPNKLTTIVYNGQGATCAPSTVLVDGKPPAVVCSRTEQATTDASGALGFAAGLTGTARTWSYTYTTYGRLLSATDPNGKTTTTTYYADDDPDLGRRGNVATVTNPANHLTRYSAYNLHGQPTQIVDANGLTTDLTYDLRLRLTSRKVGTELTTFTYDPRGLLTKVTLPDAAAVTYTYDAAHRLTQIADQRGNKITYTLDAIGNRISEKATDTSGSLVRNIQRSIDALNRVQQMSGVQ
jgi:YD repeat-containing protein